MVSSCGVCECAGLSSFALCCGVRHARPLQVVALQEKRLFDSRNISQPTHTLPSNNHTHKPTGPADELPLSQQQLVAEAAQGKLTRALHQVLKQLQPWSPMPDTLNHQHQHSPPRAVHPGGVLSCLQWFVPEGVMEPGQQQDAAEALEVRVMRVEWLTKW